MVCGEPLEASGQGTGNAPEHSDVDAGVDTTTDRLFDGRLVIRQPRTGYRFSLDAVLLAGLTSCGPEERAVDLGTGCGVVPLIMSYRGCGLDWVGVEIQEELARLAAANVAANGYSGRIRIERADFGKISGRWPRGWSDLVVSNPPYRQRGAGRISPNGQRALARHERADTLEKLLQAAHHVLKPSGRLALVYPASRLARLIEAAAREGFSVKRIIPIYTKPAEAARLVHAVCSKEGGDSLIMAPPFVVHGEDGRPSAAMAGLYVAKS